MFARCRRIDLVLAILVLPLAGRGAAASDAAAELRRLRGHDGVVWCVSYSPDGRHALSGGDDKVIRLWDLVTGKEVRRLVGHTARVNEIMFSPDGRQAVSAGFDKTARLWDVDTGKELRRFVGHTDRLRWVAFAPDQRRIASTSDDGSARVWDAATGGQLFQFQGNNGVRFSPDGQLLVTGGTNGDVSVWSLKEGKLLRGMKGHGATSSVGSVVFSADGKHILSCGDTDLILWKTEDGRRVHRLHGHTEGVVEAAISPDGRLAWSVGLDKTVRLWDLEKGKELECLKGRAAFDAVGFSPDGFYCLTGSRDGFVRLYELSFGYRDPAVKPRVSIPTMAQLAEEERARQEEQRPAVMLRLAENFLAGGKVDKARGYWKEITSKYPDSPAAAEAETLLKKHAKK